MPETYVAIDGDMILNFISLTDEYLAAASGRNLPQAVLYIHRMSAAKLPDEVYNIL